MKKTISILSVFIIILTMLFLFAGCSNKSIEESKEAVASYYESFENNDVRGITDLFDDSLIEYLGGEEEAEIIMGSRIAVLGEDVEYSIYATSYSKDNGDIMVVLEAEAEYVRDGETYEEKFQLENIDDKMVITQVSLEREKVVESLPQRFVEVYNEGDEDSLPGLFADAYYSYFTQDDLYAMMDSFWMALGSVKDIELADEYVYCLDIEEDGVILVQESYYDAEFENGGALLWMELCNEDGEIKIYDIFCIPDLVQNTVDGYYALMEKGDYESAADMYHDAFYNIENGRAAWIGILKAVSGYGQYLGNEVIYWKYFDTVLEDGTEIPGITAVVNSQFGDTVFRNEITISLDPEDQRILEHIIEINE